MRDDFPPWKKHFSQTTCISAQYCFNMGRRAVLKLKFKHWQKTRKGLVDKVGKDVMADKEGKLKVKIQAIFTEFDLDGDGGIDENELRQGMAALGVTLNDDEVRKLLTDADADGDGSIQVEEFEAVVREQIELYEDSLKPKAKTCSIL